ncbi:MAG TPA: inactive serine/threonine-protein kinase VRK3, partial [Polyangia bacterium]|nr:inactive serine/threonine-protein kinase VRK3 [Polyangia bacterium]
MSRCPHCDEEIEDGARFCGACGRPITATAISQRAAAAALKSSAAASTIRVSPPAPGAPAGAAPPAAGPGPNAPHPVAAAGSIPYPAPPPGAAVSSSPSIAPATPLPARPAVGLRPAAQPLESLIGRTLNHRYVVEDKVGEGGFGAVFRGKQLATGRAVALKILHPHNVSDETI